MTSRLSQFSSSRLMKSPRSSRRIRRPLGASLYASVPPPAPVPMMITSNSSFISVLLSDEGDRGRPGAGRAPELRVGEDERELADAVRGEPARVEVLDHEHSVAHVEQLRHLE